MAEKTQFADATLPFPEPGTVCCYYCAHAQREQNVPLGTIASTQRFVKCIWGPPSVLIFPAGLDQTTGQMRFSIKSQFPVMGYTEFCHRFELN